jgi:hypothetical protein
MRRKTKTKPKPVRITYLNGEPWILSDDEGEEWSIADGTPPPPDTVALEKELSKRLKREATAKAKNRSTRSRRRS